MPEPDRPRLIAPPPLLFAVCVIVAVIVDTQRPLPLFAMSDPFRYTVSAVVFLMSIALGLSAVRVFLAHKEHPDPYKPTQTIVDSGPFRFTRNPIYISFLMIAFAIAVLDNSLWVLLSMIPLALLLDFGVIRREEEYLSRKFGAVYDDYRRRVRRWI